MPGGPIGVVDGLGVGDGVAVTVGDLEGALVGGGVVGDGVGRGRVGEGVGFPGACVGSLVGKRVGTLEGFPVGLLLGDRVGGLVAPTVGFGVGEGVVGEGPLVHPGSCYIL